MGNRLFVGNLSFNSTEDTVADAFEQAGFKPSSVTILYLIGLSLCQIGHLIVINQEI